MKKWIPILLGSIGSFFILKSLFKIDQDNKHLIVVPLSKTEIVKKAIPVKEKITENPTTNASEVVQRGSYLESGKVNINSKR